MYNIKDKIKEIAHQQGMSLPQLARKLNMTRDGLYKILRTNDLKTSRLLQISRVLNHNFFKYYFPIEKSNQPDRAELLIENKILQNQIELLQLENKQQKELINLLKSKL